MLWVMLNPSTADAEKDDPTIRACMGFTWNQWGYQGMMVGNLFAFRETSPTALFKAAKAANDIVGPENDRWLSEMARDAAIVVLAWGANVERTKQSIYRASAVESMFRSWHRNVWTLGVTKDGHYKHPLMQKYDTPLIEAWK